MKHKAAEGQRESFRNKYLALTVSMLLFSFAFGQVPQKQPIYGVEWNRSFNDSVLKVPIGLGSLRVVPNIGNRTFDTAQVRYNKSDSSFRIWTGYQWLKLGTGSGTGGNDSAYVRIILLNDSTLVFVRDNEGRDTVIFRLGGGGGGGGSGVTSVTSADGNATVANTTTTPVITIVSAPKLTTPRAIYGNNFDGSAALTQIIASTFGGTGNGFTKLSGPATSEKTFTLPNFSSTILTDNAAVTIAQGGTGVGSFTAGDIPYYASGTAFSKLAIGTANQLLRTNAGATAPEWFNPSYITGNQTITFTPTGDVTGPTTGTTSITPALVIGTNKVLNTMLAQMAANTIKGNNTGSTSNAADLTVSQTKTMLALDNVDNTSDATKNSATSTLTNKRWTARVGSTTSSATPTINTDNVDKYKLTAQAANANFSTNLSGTPNDGDVFEIEVTGTGSFTITWGASFVSSTVTLPTAITTTTTTYIFEYKTTSSYGNNKWTLANYF